MKIEFAGSGLNWVEGALTAYRRGADVIYDRDVPSTGYKWIQRLVTSAWHLGAWLAVCSAGYLILWDNTAWIISLMIGLGLLAMSINSLNRRKQLQSLAMREFGRDLQREIPCSIELTSSHLIYEDRRQIISQAWWEIVRVIATPARVVLRDRLGRVYVIADHAFVTDTAKKRFLDELLCCLSGATSSGD
jgi:hypothetical protein